MTTLGNRRRLLKEDVDLISNLPDAILWLILSFLPTKHVIRTSILSKRWKYVWAKVPALDFSEMAGRKFQRLSLRQKICFMSLVDRALLHNDASYVQRFCFDFSDVDAFYVNSWLIAAARREIHELNIARILRSSMQICLPPRFLMSEKLVVLKLMGKFDISASVSFHLPKLETVHLMFLKFPDDEFMKRLSSGCPVLKELRIDSCFGITTTLHVESLSLKSLEIITNVEGNNTSCVVIKTPNLLYLHLDGSLSSYDIGEMSSLIEANLDIEDPDYVEELLTKVSGVKSLSLGPTCLLTRKLPVFRNLTFLKYEPDHGLCRLLNCVPRLKSLVLGSYIEEFLSNPNLEGLESVELSGIFGEEKEIDTIAYFLKAALALKEMKIGFDCGEDRERVNYQKLLDLPRSSAICRIKVV